MQLPLGLPQRLPQRVRVALLIEDEGRGTTDDGPPLLTFRARVMSDRVLELAEEVKMPHQTSKLTTQSAIALRQYLVEHFTLEEIKTLCADVNVIYENLQGEGLEPKARELVSHLNNEFRIPELVQKCREECRTVPMPELAFEPLSPVVPSPQVVVPRASEYKSEPSQLSDEPEPRPKDEIRIRKQVVVIAVGAIVVATLLLLAGVSFQYSPFCSSLVFDTLDDVSTWSTFAFTDTTRAFVVSLPGWRNKAAAISFSLREGEWILITKEIRPGTLKGTEGVSFYYAGSGAPNTIEIKFFYENNAIFSAERNRATNTQGWEHFVAPYTSFACWTSTGCSEKDKLNLDRVVKVDIAVSSKNGGEAGSGIVLVDDLRFIKPWSWMCLR